MPVPDQGPGAQTGHGCHRAATSAIPATSIPRATPPHSTHDGRPRCQGHRRLSAGRRGTQRSAGSSAEPSRVRGRAGTCGRMICMGLGTGSIVGECTAGRLHFIAGEILAAIIIVPLLTGAILVTVAVFGSSRSSDRVFRLLRWSSDKEEPPAPSPVTTVTALGHARRRTGHSACAAGRTRHDRRPHY